MDHRTRQTIVICILMCGILTIGALAQGARGKAEMKAGAGMITVDYGQPALKGRDMLSKLEVGQFWRMGSNQATTLTTPVDLMFGSTKIAKGSYTLFLKRESADAYQLVFNSQTGQWGTERDASKDVAAVPMKKEALASPVEVLTIGLKPAAGGGTFSLSWGTLGCSADFKIQ
jgi:hypothetical protein